MPNRVALLDSIRTCIAVWVVIWTGAIHLAAQVPAETRAQGRLDRPGVPAIKVDVELVLINVTITDSLGRYVADLEPQHFRLWEDKVEQKIGYFSSEDVPVSVGMIFDRSGSMGPSMGLARDAATTFLRTAGVDDEYFLVEFNDRAHVTVDLTSDVGRLQGKILSIPSKGSTALYDAVYLGMEKIRKANNSRKALLVITDGEENHSRYTFSNLQEFVREQNVQIFSIGALGPVTRLAELTGGYAFRFGPGYDVFQKIAIELRNQYIIGYLSTNESKDGRWRKVKVEVNPPRGLSKLTVRAKSGYYASTLEAAAKPK